MNAIFFNRTVFTATILVASLVFSSTSALAFGQANITRDETGYGDCDPCDVQTGDHEYIRMTLEACHEERDRRKVGRFAHQARLEAAKFKLSAQANANPVH